MQTTTLKYDGQTTADKLPATYYNFRRYVSKERMITFWYQVRETISLDPSSVLEIGIGPGVAAGVLRERGIDVKSADVNSSLRPDYVVPVQELSSQIPDESFDVVLCARVLHHVPFEDFERCLGQLWRVTKKAAILTLPIEDLRVYASFRITSLRSISFSLGLPILLKNAVCKVFPKRFDTDYRKLWKINSSPATALKNIEALLARHFKIVKSYGIPEDRSHHVFVLSRQNGAVSPITQDEMYDKLTHSKMEVKSDD